MSNARLFELLNAIGPSGNERRAAELWRNQLAAIAGMRTDVVGNSYASIAGDPECTQHIALVAHIDEIGIIVKSIDDEGMLWIDEVGGWDPQVLAAQRVTLIGNDGLEVIGVIGRKPIHLMESSDLETATKLKDLWVDIGARDKATAEALVSVGDVGVVDTWPQLLGETRVMSRALDNRIGAYIVGEVLRKLSSRNKHAATVTGVVSTMEEIGYRGARVAVEKLRPTIAIAIDVTFATDVGDLDKKQQGDHALGSGPVVFRAAFHSPVVDRLLRQVADEQRIKYTIGALGGHTGTDADAMALGTSGVATGVVCVPLRYMHTPGEIIDLDDVWATIDLLTVFCETVTHALDLTAR